VSYHVLYESCGWHTRCALFDEHGRLLTLRYDDMSRRHIEGAVVWGRVRQVVPSLGAAFVDIGDTHDGVLNLKHLPHGVSMLTTGQGLLVRITRGGFGEKGANLDARVAYKELPKTGTKPHVVLPAPSALQRSLRDAGSMPVKVWLPHGVFRDAVAKVVPERQIFLLGEAHDAPDLLGLLDDELARIGMPVPTFPFMNGDVVVELTSAVATIDINFRPLEGVSKGDAVLAANLTAAETVARLVRLLDLGGSVVIDFLTPKTKAQREMIYDHLDAALSTTDDHYEHLRPLSPNGLCELTRARTGPSLMLLVNTAPYLAGAVGLNLWRMPAGFNPAVRQHTVRANPAVAEILNRMIQPEDALRHLGRPVQVVADGALALSTVQLAG
jgi:Ribonuclease E/G family